MIYVITAVHNRREITKTFIRNILSQSYKDIKLVIVDDGSNDGTAEMIKENAPDAVVLKGDGDLWWGGALHMAYKWLVSNAQDADRVMFANDDTHFDGDYVETAIKLLGDNEDALVTGCGFDINTGKQIDGAVHWNFKTGKGEGEWKCNDEGNCASTRSIFFTVKTLKDIGGFHPHRLPHYASDYEWTIRAARKGHKILSFEELRYTFDPGTTGENDLAKLTFKKLFSKRSNANPVYKMNFLFMSTPIKYLPSHIMCQLARYLKKIGVFMKIAFRREKK